jgi:putative ABC transport system permease protein
MRADLRWIRADLRARPGQALLLAGVVAGVVAALILAFTLLGGALNPWKGTFARSNGADIWVSTPSGVGTREVTQGVSDLTAVSGPYQTVATTLLARQRRVSLQLEAMSPALPSVGRPLVSSGHWLSAGRPGGIVLEQTLARSLGEHVGDAVTVQDLGGGVHRLTVAGIAATAQQGPYPAWTPGLGWVLPGTLNSIDAKGSDHFELFGLRLAHPGQAAFWAQQVYNESVNSGHWQVSLVSTWQNVQSAMEVNNRLLGLLLAMFGAVALVAAVLVIANTTAGRIVALLPDIGLAKVLGFTPRQITRTLMLQQCGLGAAGTLVGIGIAQLLTSSWLVDWVFGSVTEISAAPFSPGSLALVGGGTVAAVALATLPAAWRAGRVPPLAIVEASPPVGRLSRMARLAFVLRLPPPLVLGVRDAVSRRARAALTVGGLVLPIIMITIGLGCWATLNNFTGHPAQIGLAAAFTATAAPGAPDDPGVLARDPDVAAVYPEAEQSAEVPAQNLTIKVRSIKPSLKGGGLYPFPIKQGRMFKDPGEAIAGQGLLNLLGVSVGDELRVTINGTGVEIRIVGRTIEPDNDGQVLTVGADTLEEFGVSDTTPTYAVVVRHGVSPAAVASRLQQESDNGLDIEPVDNPARQLGVIRVAVAALIVVLTLIAFANMATATSVGLRDHRRDVAVLRAMGLTSRQVTATSVIGTAVLAVIAAVVGAAIGLVVSDALINMQGRNSGIGTGIAREPGPLTLGVLVVLAIGLSGAVAALRTRRAANAEISTTLTT